MEITATTATAGTATLVPQGGASSREPFMPAEIAETAVGAMGGGATDTRPWERSLRPAAGIEELRWFHENLPQLAGYENRWVALLGQRIVAYGDTIEQVRDELRERGIYDALVLLVPADVRRREYFIG